VGGECAEGNEFFEGCVDTAGLDVAMLVRGIAMGIRYRVAAFAPISSMRRTTRR
jgi:hypothetical protein